MAHTPQQNRRRFLAAAAVISIGSLGIAAPASAGRGHSSSRVTVTSSADSGPGTLRDALASGATRIRIPRSVGDIEILSTLEFTGSELTLDGSGQTIHGNGIAETLLRTTSADDVDISDLNFSDGGGFGLPPAPSTGYGIHVVVPADATGWVRVDLDRVGVSGVGGHGVFVDDNAESPASVRLDTSRVEVDDVGTGGFDQDGVRVDETGDGSIFFRSRHSDFTNAGADGVELDERGSGDVKIDVSSSSFNLNGDYCLPIDPESPPYADPTCVEDDDGDLVLDLDDGFDVDEADAGSIRGKIESSELLGNFDEGLDFDEAGEGNIDVDVRRVTTADNTDEGIKFSEEDGGSVIAELYRVSVATSGDDGVQLEEEGDGNVKVSVSRSSFTASAKHGINIDEADAGSLRVKVRRSSSTGNDGYGIAAEQDTVDADTGALTLSRTDLSGNTDGETDLEGVTL